MFQLKLSSARLTLEPFSPSFIARLFSFSWNSIATEENKNKGKHYDFWNIIMSTGLVGTKRFTCVQTGWNDWEFVDRQNLKVSIWVTFKKLPFWIERVYRDQGCGIHKVQHSQTWFWHFYCNSVALFISLLNTKRTTNHLEMKNALPSTPLKRYMDMVTNIRIRWMWISLKTWKVKCNSKNW